MPKKMRKEIDRRFKASINRQYAEQSIAIRFQKATNMSTLCYQFRAYQTPENPFIDRVEDSFTEFLDIQGDLSRQEQKSAAIRIKQDHGIEIGLRDRFRLWRSERKEAKLTAKMEQKYQEIRRYTEGMAERCVPESDLKYFFESATAVIDQSRDTPEVAMDEELLMNNAVAESGYVPEPTAAEQEAAIAAAENAQTINREEEPALQDQEQQFYADEIAPEEPTIDEAAIEAAASMMGEQSRATGQKTADGHESRRPVDPSVLGMGNQSVQKPEEKAASASLSPKKEIDAHHKNEEPELG